MLVVLLDMIVDKLFGDVHPYTTERTLRKAAPVNAATSVTALAFENGSPLPSLLLLEMAMSAGISTPSSSAFSTSISTSFLDSGAKTIPDWLAMLNLVYYCRQSMKIVEVEI